MAGSTTSATVGSPSRWRRWWPRSRPMACFVRSVGSRRRELLVGLLVTRLRLTALLDRHPEILDVPVEAPIIVLGLPRTGTTHLHDLLAADPGLRSLPYWESIEPILDGDGRPPEGQPDPRRERAELGLSLINTAMPLFAAMHEMTTDGPHEEIQLLAVDFSTMLFEASYQVPGYVSWYRTHGQTHAYRTLRVLLQALQFLRPAGDRWLLKSPQHLEQLGPSARGVPRRPHRPDPPRSRVGHHLVGDHVRVLPAHQLRVG